MCIRDRCGPGPGSYNHTTSDARSFAAWGADYLKEDSCAASQNHTEAFAEYGRMRDALNATGRPIVFSVCGWFPWYSNPDPALGYGGGKTLGNMWRIGPDDTNWQGVLTNININSALAKNAGPGGWNDPCLLLAEDSAGNLRISQLQSRAQFSMWAVMASPLIISANIRNMSTMNVETYTNAEVIAVDQDPLGVQGERIAGLNLQALSEIEGGAASEIEAGAASADSCSAGALAAGGDVHKANMTIAQATAWCDANVGCVGFTAHQPGACAAANGSAVFEMYFKDASVARNDDKNWTTWQKPGSTTNIWARPLTGGRWALVFLNVGATTVDLACDESCMAKTSLAGKEVMVRDLWTHRDLGKQTVHTLTAKALSPKGGHAMYLLTPA